MKGVGFDEILWTALVLITLVVGFLALLLFFTVQKIPGLGGGDPLSYTLEFVDVVNRPYMVAHILSNTRMGDRNVVEHGIEISVTENLERASSENLPIYLQEFLDQYEFNFYSVKIKDEDDIFMNINNIPIKCGDNLEGFCFPKVLGKDICNVGWNILKPYENKCGSDKSCCAFDPEKYGEETNRDVVICGYYGEGVCSVEIQLVKNCGPTGEKIDDDNFCKDNKINKGKTGICCEPFSEQVAVVLTRASSASIPLFFKGNLSYLEVTISE